MSAEFKNIRKKIPQAKLRGILNDLKNKRSSVSKIDSPLAKYNDLGQLTCVLCKSLVRSESIWLVHVNSKQHREKVEQAKSLKERINNLNVPQKRPLTPPLENSSKKLKGILKNATTSTTINPISTDSNNVAINLLHNTVQKDKIVGIKKLKEEKMEVDVNNTNPIPEGFFDDPKEDAKARHIDYKDPIDEEWERFQKVIKDANNESAAIIAVDQEEATNERQIDEIDEQLKNWSRVLTLERKKTEVITTANKELVNIEEEITDDDENFDEYLDWRSKSFKL